MSGARLRAAAAGVAAVALGAGLAEQARGALHGCVDAGILTSVALHVSVLRPDGVCPSGGYALGSASNGAVLVLSVALPVLVANALLAMCGVGVLGALRTGLRTVADVGRTYLRRAAHRASGAARVLVPAGAARTLPATRAARVASTPLLAMDVWSHRGPPLVA